MKRILGAFVLHLASSNVVVAWDQVERRCRVRRPTRGDRGNKPPSQRGHGKRPELEARPENRVTRRRK